MLTRSEPPLAGRVLVAPTTPALLAGPDNPDALPAAIRDEIIAGLEADKAAYLAAAAPGFFGGENAVSAELCRWGVALAERASLRTSVALIETLWQADLRAELPAITLPTLIVHGDADTAAPLDLCGRRTAAAIPDSQLEIYPGAPHGLPLARNHKDHLADRLAEFTHAIARPHQQRG